MAKLSEICDVRDGTHDSPKYVEKGYPLVTSKNIVDSKLDLTTVNYISEEDCNKINERSKVDCGDIIMPMIGTIGNPCLIEDEPNFAIKNVALIKFHKTSVSNKYIYYYLKSDKFYRYITENNRGGTQKFLSLKDIRNIDIPVPDVNCQHKIVETFEKLNKLIYMRKQQLSKLDELLKSRFIELFGDPNTNKMGWNKEQLQFNATLLNGRAYKQEELLDDGKYPVLRVGNFFSNRGWYFSDLELEEEKYCDNGDLLYAWSASFGPKIWDGGKVIYHYHIWKVLVGEKYNKQFLCNLLEYATASFMGDTHGIGMMHLTKSGMEQTEFIVPPMELQEQFAAFVKQTDKSKLAIQQSLEHLETLKKSLMQQYFG